MGASAGIRDLRLETKDDQRRHKRQTVKTRERKAGEGDEESPTDSDKTAVVVVVDGRNDEEGEIASGVFEILNIDGGNPQTGIN